MVLTWNKIWKKYLWTYFRQTKPNIYKTFSLQQRFSHCLCCLLSTSRCQCCCQVEIEIYQERKSSYVPTHITVVEKVLHSCHLHLPKRVYLSTKYRLYHLIHKVSTSHTLSQRCCYSFVNVTKTADSQQINLSTDRLEMLSDTYPCHDLTHSHSKHTIIAHLI